MKPYTKATLTFAVALFASQLVSTRSFAQPFPAGPGQETTSSLGIFRIVVNPTFQGMMAGYPGYDGAGRLTSPVLNDPTTLIGRSAVHQHGDASDASGLPVGAAGTIVSDANFTEQPPGFQGPLYTHEVHTEIRKLNMTGGSAAVRAGTSAPGAPISPGEVQSLSGASGNSALDFPAQSFFDIFVEVDLPAGGSFLGATFYNDRALLVRNTNLTSFPPPVVYMHESSSAVPIRFKTTGPGPWIAGDLFGLLLLGGHALASNDTATVAAFTATVLGSPELPVDPQYSTWAPGLTVASNSFPGLGDDNTYSLGSFTVVVNPAYQAMFAGAAYPGYNTVTKRLVSPTLFDPATVIGRSAPTNDASPGDIAGITCGVLSPAIVGQSSYSLFPFGFDGPAGTRQVMTKVTSLNMTGGGAAVRAGTAAPGRPISVGQVESLSANSGNTNIDFPAESFFDIFVAVDLPAAGPVPAFTVTNKEPLIVHDNQVRDFPPKVIYIHGNSTAVPVMFTSPGPGWVPGDTFGILTLAGHGISYRKDSGTPGGSDQQEFEQTMQQQPEARVSPQYATWAPGLVVAPTPPTISSLTLSNGLAVIKGVGMPNTQYYLTRTFLLAPNANWLTNGSTSSDLSGNFQMNTTVSPAIPQSYYRIAGPPLPQ